VQISNCLKSQNICKCSETNIFKSMVKIFNILGIIFLSNACFGQFRLFIKPTYQSKNSFARLAPENNINEKFPFQNKGFYMPFSNSFTSPFVTHPTFDIGLSVGVISEDKKHLFEIEYSKDHCGYRTKSYFSHYLDPNSNSLDFYWYPNLNRFSLNYSLLICSKKNYGLRFTTSAGILTNKKNNLNRLAEQFYTGMFVAPNVEITSAYIQPFQEKKTNVFLKIGLQNDFSIKSKYIASLSLHYLQGIGQISFVQYTQEYNINGIPSKNSVGLFSRGSGVYLELSRRINVYKLK
jgi:hypothetical protein